MKHSSCLFSTVGILICQILFLWLNVTCVAKTLSLKEAISIVGFRNRTVVVTSANAGYLNHVHNFQCFVSRLNIKVLFFAMDQRAHDYVSSSIHLNRTLVSYNMMQQQQTNQTFRHIKGTDAERTHQIKSSLQSSLVVEESPAEYHTHAFHVITTRKIEAVLMVLRLGYDVLFIDSDVVLLKDPFPFLQSAADYVFSINKPCPSSAFDFGDQRDEGNTGFFFMRSTPATISLLDATIAAAPTFPGLDDQSIFWRVIRSTKAVKVVPMKSCGAGIRGKANTQRDLFICPLDECIFSVGALRGSSYQVLMSELAKRRAMAVAIHANWIKGLAAKVKALNSHGLWLARENGMCKEYIPKL